MVNSGSYENSTGGEGDSVKADFTQLEGNVTSTAASPRHIVGACAREDEFTAATAEMIQQEEETKAESATTTSFDLINLSETKTSLHCSVPLHKVKDVLNIENQFSNFLLESLLKKNNTAETTEGQQKNSPKRLLCLFCDRTFQTASLKQKHVDRCHSSGQSRRSSRSAGNGLITCIYCNKLNHTEHSWSQLFEHLVNEHSNRYFGCLNCQERFTSSKHLQEHNKTIHHMKEEAPIVVKSETPSPKLTDSSAASETSEDTEIVKRITRSLKNSTPSSTTSSTPTPTPKNHKKLVSVKSTKNGVRTKVRTRRAAAIALKQMSSDFVKFRNKKQNTKSIKQAVSKSSEPESVKAEPEPKTEVVNSSSVFSLVNLFTYKYEKIYDHASDSIRDVNSGKFDVVYDREFYIRTVNNIKENLLLHLDGKLNRNVQSENRISNFEQVETEAKAVSASNFGCDLSLNAITPVATLLSSSQYGEDFDAQIEYTSKPTQKKSKKDKTAVYKFNNRKYNSLFRERGDHSDLTSLDMWTQLKIKEKQHNGNITVSEAAQQQVNELNTILDTRAPFEDLKLEQQALIDEAKSKKSDKASEDVNVILEELLLNVFETIQNIPEEIEEKPDVNDLNINLEVPEYLKLQKNTCKLNKGSGTDSVELTGEWARSRLYVCATCAQKLPNLKALDEHKNVSHPNIWCTHYEFVGKQSEFYTHLGIPGLGKVGIVEMMPMTKYWQRSDARLCSKCAKQCNSLSELHRHMLECGGDWTWMLARKKVKYRPYGARTRRRRQRGYKRTINPLLINRPPREPKVKPIGPRPKPSDAESIEKMLANLPAKRIRKVISMRDGIQRPRKSYIRHKNLTEPVPKEKPSLPPLRIHPPKQFIRTLRSRVSKSEEQTKQEKKIQNKRAMNRVLGTKILDTNMTILTRRRLAKTVTQNDFIRRTRLRTKMTERNEGIQNKVVTRSEVKNVDTEEKQMNKKKSASKRLLSLITKPKKKLKVEETKVEDPPKKTETKAKKSTKKELESKFEVKDTISEVIDSVARELDVIPVRDTISEVIEAVIKNTSGKPTIAKVIRKKTNKIVDNVKSIKKDIKKKTLKGKDASTKLLRTLSLRGSKRQKKKTEEGKTTGKKKKKVEEVKQEEETVPKNGLAISDSGKVLEESASAVEVTEQTEVDSENKQSDLETMPTLEKFEPLPVDPPIVDSIPVLTPIETKLLSENKQIDSTHQTEQEIPPITISEVVKPINIVKNKFKRTGKGLNDCIAMLKCKLEMKNETSPPTDVLNAVDKLKPLVVEPIIDKPEDLSNHQVPRQKVEIIIQQIAPISEEIIDLSMKTVDDRKEEIEETVRNVTKQKLEDDDRTDDTASKMVNLKLPKLIPAVGKEKPEVEHTTVLEIPTFTRNLIPTPEPQIQDLIGDKINIQPVEIIPDIQLNQITSVLDAAMKNCLLECVKSKCEELNKNVVEIIPKVPVKLKAKKIIRKIGSVRKRRTVKKPVEKKTEESVLNEVSDDDVPLSNFIKLKFQKRPSLKLKLPRKKGKQKTSTRILVDKTKTLSLEDKIEQHVELDNSINNQIEQIQSEIVQIPESESVTIENIVENHVDIILSPEPEPEINEIKDIDQEVTAETPKTTPISSLPFEPTTIEPVVKCSTPISTENVPKVLLSSFPLQLMNIEDEPSEICLNDKTLNTEPIIESAKFPEPEPEVNHMDSGKENSITKMKTIIRRQKKITKKGRKKILENGLSPENDVKKEKKTKLRRKRIVEKIEAFEMILPTSWEEVDKKTDGLVEIMENDVFDFNETELLVSQYETEEKSISLDEISSETDKPEITGQTRKKRIKQLIISDDSLDISKVSDESKLETTIPHVEINLETTEETIAEPVINDHAESNVVLALPILKNKEKRKTKISEVNENSFALPKPVKKKTQKRLNQKRTKSKIIIEQSNSVPNESLQNNEVLPSLEEISSTLQEIETDLLNALKNDTESENITEKFVEMPIPCKTTSRSRKKQSKSPRKKKEMPTEETHEEELIEPTEPEVVPLETQLPNQVPNIFDEIPKTPNLDSGDSEDEIPLSFIAKTLGSSIDDDVLNDLAENLETRTPSILENNIVLNEDESNLEKAAELLENKNLIADLDKIDETALDISYDIEEPQKSFITTPDMNNQSLVIKIQKKFNVKIKKNKKTKKRLTKSRVRPEPESEVEIFCDICNKSFRRNENLVKHKRTLTHISKLSEIEAKENEERQKLLEEEEKRLKTDDIDRTVTLLEKSDDIEQTVNTFLQKPYDIEQTVNTLLEKSDDIEQTVSTLLEKSDDVEQTVDTLLEKSDDIEQTVDTLLEKSDDIEQTVDTIDLINDLSSNKTRFDKTTNLKLVDIINDVLDKPVDDLNMTQSVLLPKTLTNSLDIPEQKRYRSLGERKSFDSDYIPQPLENDFVKPTTNQLLTTQLSLLENIIEKNSSDLNYIDDSISYSSNENTSTKNTDSYPEPEIKFSHNNDIISSFIKPNSFVKPLANFDEQTQQFQDSSATKETPRKILNRDEELFLECCSLLKSGSESMSKKQSNYIPRDSYSWLAQNSRVETPIGEPYVNNDWSNSNSGVSSEWLTNKSAPIENKKDGTIHFEDISLDSSTTRNTEISPAVSKHVPENVPLDFHHINFEKSDLKSDSVVYEEINEEKTKQDDSLINEVDENLKRHVVSAFGGLMAKALKSRLKAVVRRSVKAKEKRTFVSALQPAITNYAISLKKPKFDVEENNSNDNPKKIVTKGAMKVFEGIKVSIPTQDLNLQEVLKSKTAETGPITEVASELFNPSPIADQKIEKLVISKKKISKKKQLFKKIGNKLGLKETKKKNNKKLKQIEKPLDVYDFEDSQDNNSLLKTNLSDFRNYRKQDVEIEEWRNNEMISHIDSESETDRYYDSISFEENSLSSESNIEESCLKESDVLLKKDNRQKCMIMGRIFKNASKPKLEDKIPEIRDISSEENSKLVENYLESYSSFDNIESTIEPFNSHGLTIINSANKMSKHEMDQLFDKLLEENKDERIGEDRLVKKIIKPKIKSVKKRQRPHSDDSTSADEFMLSKSSKKPKRRQKKDEGINLEQEIKECIGVAGRKSQRKCTSGKQNVLAEFWSSDESEIDFVEKSSEVPVEKSKDLYEFEPEFDEINEIVPKLEHKVLEKTESVTNENSPEKKQDKHKHKDKKVIKNRRHSKSPEDSEFEEQKSKNNHKHKRSSHSESSNIDMLVANRRKRNAVETLYYWSSTSDDDELQDMIEIKPIREDTEEDRPMQHGWIVGDSPKKLVTMLAQAKGLKKIDCDSVKEQGKKSRTTL